MNVSDRPPAPPRSTLRSVALPKEHGGWGLTLEPGVLALLVAPGAAGVCLAAAALVAFTARTPLKVVLVDRHRGRSLARTRMAARVARGELFVLAVLIVVAVVLANDRFWAPALVAGPLIVVELSFEMRSRGRRLAPELAGAVGVCSVAAMIVLADGGSGRLAAGLWLVLAARVVTSIPHVRGLIARLHGRTHRDASTIVWDCVAITGAGAAVWLDRGLVVGAIAVVAVVVIQRITTRGALPRATVLGIRQMAMGLAVVVATAAGVLASTH
jgi:YwiC-like protein